MLRVAGRDFVDEQGRRLVLRGVNLGGSSKVPRVPDGASWRRESFFEHRSVSFVNRPFSLEDADEHFRRLSRWGLTTLRWVTTWEAVEHEGPGRYDQGYLDFLEAILRRAGEHGFTVFVDFHQDTWSRFSGGDGAPGWTLESAGFELEHLHETGAAFLHCQHEGPLPKMIWPSNDGKLAAATMFTLFFGGDAFAPSLKVDGVGVQRFLQTRFLDMVEEVARRLRHVSCVAGYDVLNEPSTGYIGAEDLTVPLSRVKVGPLPSPLESMALGEGRPLRVGWWAHGLLGARITRQVELNPRGLRAWRSGAGCPWRAHGVWDEDAQGRPRLLAPDYFRPRHGEPVDWAEDFYRPFVKAALERIRSVDSRAIVLVEGEAQRPSPRWAPADGADVAYAPHWYDGAVLFLKDFHPFLGADFFTEKPVFWPGRIRRSYRAQLERLVEGADTRMGGVPVLLGEVGVPFDLRSKRAFRTGDFRQQAAALDRSLTAVEDARLSATVWNYTPDNTNARGDGWNDEDLSVFSVDQRREPNELDSGGRALDALVRPYPRAVAGTIVRYGFERRRRRFELVYRHDPLVSAPTEVFVPALQYPRGVAIDCSDGRFEHDAATQTLKLWPDGDLAEHRVVLMPSP